MSNGYNLYNLEPDFRSYLVAGNVSASTLKNYLSDFRYFAGWLYSQLSLRGPRRNVGGRGNLDGIATVASLSRDDMGFINIQLIENYKDYLTSSKLPTKTVNRRLSTVRKFCSFCISQGWMKENPAKHVTNITNLSLRGPRRNVGGRGNLDGIATLTQQSGSLAMTLDLYRQDLVKQGVDTQTITSSLNDVQEFLLSS